MPANEAFELVFWGASVSDTERGDFYWALVWLGGITGTITVTYTWILGEKDNMG